MLHKSAARDGAQHDWGASRAPVDTVLTRAQMGWWLTGAVSFCFSAAVVLGVVGKPLRHGAELMLDAACAFEVAAAFSKPVERAAVAHASVVKTALPEARPAIMPVVTPLPLGPDLEGWVGEVQRVAEVQPIESAVEERVAITPVEALPLPVEPPAVRHLTVAIPLPPSRPRHLSPPVRLALVREPIQFRLADRGNSF